MVRAARIHGKGGTWLRTYDVIVDRELRRGGDTVLEKGDIEIVKGRRKKVKENESN